MTRPPTIARPLTPKALCARRGALCARRTRLRDLLVGATLLISLLGAEVSQLRGQDSSLDFRRTYVPRTEIEKVGAGFQALPRDRFEETVARLRDERSEAAPARTSLKSAVWIGVFDGENVTGLARWTPPDPTDDLADATALLGRTTLFLDPAFASENVPSFSDAAVAAWSADEEAVAALASAETSRPRLFLRADGGLGATFAEGRPATTGWSARTDAADDGARIAAWLLPESRRTTLWLVVPPGVEVTSPSGWLVERISTESPTGQADASQSPRTYRLLGRPLDGEPLQLRFASTSEPPAEELLYRVANRYFRTSKGLDVEYDLALDCRAGALATLKLLLPSAVSPIELVQGDSRLVLVQAESASETENPGVVEWTAELPDSVGPSFATFKLRGIVALDPTGEGLLPQLRVPGATWAGETSTIVAEAPLEIQEVVAEDCFAATEPEPGASASERFRHRTERSTVASRFGRPPERTSVESVLSLRAGRSSLEASLFAEISAAEGPTFEQELRLLRPWSLDRIEVEPTGALLDWSIDERRTIRLRFRDGIAPGETLRLRCDAHLRIDDPTAVRSGETLRAFEFQEGVRENRAIALFDDATFRFRPVRIVDWRTLARGELSAAQRAGLGSGAPSALLSDDASFREMEFAFETEESRLDVRATTTLERSGASVAGRVKIECMSLSSPIERLHVAFSSPLPPGSRWSSSEAKDVPFEAQRIAGGDSSDGGETWELTFARPAAEPFAVIAAYELPEESSLAAPLASVPAAVTQTGRLSIATELLEEREASGVGLERVPANDAKDRPGDVAAVRFRYDPARRHSASVGSAAGSGVATLAMRGPATLETEISSTGLHHVMTYRVASSSTSTAKLTVVPPPGATLGEVRAVGADDDAIASLAGSFDVVELAAPRGLRTIQLRYFQPLPSLALWSEQRVPLPRIQDLPVESVEWTVRSRGAVSFALDAEGWNGRALDDGERTNSLGDDASGESDASDAMLGEFAFVSTSAETPLALTVYRTGLIQQAAWITFFAVAAILWALAFRAPVVSAVLIATLAAAFAFLPEPAEALRWGAIYGAAAGLVCAILFRRDSAAAPAPEEPLAGKRGLSTASALVLLALSSAGALSAFGQEVVVPPSESRTHRVLVPTDDAGQPTGIYYYLSREFYDRFLAIERELARPDEEWRIVDAVYEGTMSPGVIDGMPRLSQLTLHLEIETFADDVVATLPVGRYAEFAGMMEDGGAGDVDAEWNDAGDALSLRFEKAGRRELAIPFWPTADADRPGSRSVTILPIPWAKLFIRGPEEALDDLVVSGAVGAGERRPARENAEFDLGPAGDLVFASRRASVSGSMGPAVRWTAGLRIAGDPNDCRIGAKVIGEAPLGVLVSSSTVSVGPGWKIDTSIAEATGFRIEPAESGASGERRYDVDFDEAQAGELEFDFVLIPEGSNEAGLFRTPKLSFDGVPPAAIFAELDLVPGAIAEWTPAAPGRAATAREVPVALGLPAVAGEVRLLSPNASANFVTSDQASRPTYAVQAEFVVAPSDVRVQYEIATSASSERWREFDLPEAIEVLDVHQGPAPSRTPAFWRRNGRRLVIKTPVPATPVAATPDPLTPDPPTPLVIRASIRGLGDGSASLAAPRLRGASLTEIDLRVYRESELDVSVDAGAGFDVDPTFVPGAFVEEKGRGVGAFLSARSGVATGEPPAPPLLRWKRAAPGKATVWTSVVSQQDRPTARFEIQVEPGSGPIDRLAIEAPATLGDPTVASPPGAVTVRTAANSERRYWIFVPVQPVAAGASVTISAPLETAATERIVVRPIRLLNVEATRRIVLLPERVADRGVSWTVTRLQTAPDDEGVRRRAVAIGGDVLAFEAIDDAFSARARRVESEAATPFTIRWTERRVRFEAPGEYRALVVWDILPHEQSTLDIRMPAGTTATALDVDGVPSRWRSSEQGIHATLLPSALPFRVTLAYRGTAAVDEIASEKGQATLTLESPTIGGEASRGEAWIVEASRAAPWSVGESGAADLTSLDYVDARLAAFETTFSAGAPRTEDCTPDETRSFALQRLRDLNELQRRTNAQPASAERDGLLARLDAATKPYREALLADVDAGATSISDAKLSALVGRDDDRSIDRDSARLLAFRLGRDTNLATIELALTSRDEPASVPWRRIAETTAIVVLCLVVLRLGRRLLRWFEQMPLPVGSLAFVLLAPLFVPAAWLAPAMIVAFLAFAAVAARRWLLPLLPPARGRGVTAP